jgi:hypothetical protein
MKRLFLALILFCNLTGVVLAEPEQEPQTPILPAEEISVEVPKEQPKQPNRFIISEPMEIYLPDDVKMYSPTKELQPVVYENHLDDKGKFNFSLKYDDSNRYSHQYNVVERVDANYEGKLTDKVDFKLGTTAKNLYDERDSQIVLSNSYLTLPVSDKHHLSIGNARLSNSNGSLISFMEDAEYAYGVNDVGMKLYGNIRKVDYSIGAYNFDNAIFESNQNLSKGIVLSYNPFEHNKFLSSLKIGTGYYGKEINNENKNTYGLFSSYKYKRLGLRSEYSRNFVDDNVFVDNWNVIPEVYLTKNLTFRAKHKQWAEQQAYGTILFLII